MSTLCDMNVLLALVTDRHALHTTGVHWFDDVPPGGATIYRVVQMGLLRLLNNPSVMREDTLDAATCWDLWHQLLEDQRLRYTPIEPNGLDAAFERFTTGKVFTPRLWTDAYQAAYALVSGLVLVSFDQGLRQFVPSNAISSRLAHRHTSDSTPATRPDKNLGAAWGETTGTPRQT